jgi:hypothetical protein
VAGFDLGTSLEQVNVTITQLPTVDRPKQIRNKSAIAHVDHGDARPGGAASGETHKLMGRVFRRPLPMPPVLDAGFTVLTSLIRGPLAQLFASLREHGLNSA